MAAIAGEGRTPAQIGVATLAVLGLASSVFWQRGMGVCFWLIAITGLLVVIWGHRRPTFAAPDGSAVPSPVAVESSLWWVAVLPTLLNLASVLWFDLEWRALDVGPWLVFPLIVVAVRWARVSMFEVALGAAIACWAAMAVFLVAWATSSDPRVNLPMNAIIVAQAACTAALVCLWMAGRCRVLHRHALIASTIVGLVAALAIGLRAFLTIVPLYLVVFACWPRDGRSSLRGWLVLTAVCAAVVGGFLLWGSQDSFFGRLMQMQAEIASFESGRVQYSSTGSRLALWHSALRFAYEHPIFGIGADQFGQGIQRLREQGLFPGDVFVFNHAHNSYLNILAEFGLIGVIVGATVVRLLWRLLTLDDQPARILARYVLIMWLLLALTNDVLGHQQTIRLITLLLALCLACLGPAGARILPPRTPGSRAAPADV